jgi:hypothetical protein
MEDNIIYKIYGLYALDDESKIIRYVGYTKRTIKKRLSSHIHQSKERDTHKDRWIRKNNRNIDVILIEDNINTYELVLEREIYWIDYYKKIGNDLVNSTAGGDGTKGRSPSMAERERSRKLNLGKKLSEEHKAKIGKSHKGKILSLEHKQKLKDKKQNVSDETKQKMSIMAVRRFLREKNIFVDDLLNDEIVHIKQLIIEYDNLIKQLVKTPNDDIEFYKNKNFENKLNYELKKSEEYKLGILTNNAIAIKIKEDKLNIIRERELKKNFLIQEKINKQQLIKTERELKKQKEYESRQKLIDSGDLYQMVNSLGKLIWVRKTSEQTKQKLREANLGKKYSEETKRKHSETNFRIRNGKKGVKLTEGDIREIRRLCDNEKTTKELTEIYNMDYSTIRKIVLRKLWSDIK